MTKIEIIPRINPITELQMLRRIMNNKNVKLFSKNTLLIIRIIKSRVMRGTNPRIKLVTASLLFIESGSYKDL
jgi:hypothetical protein